MIPSSPPELKPLEKLHGHLGPYAVIGYRMGVLARQKLGEGWMSAVVETGLKKPLSCIIDGIQISTSCTLGKGNIKVLDNKIPKASFMCAQKKFALRLKEQLWKELERKVSKEMEFEQALYYYNMPDEELFEIGAVLDLLL